MVFQAHNLFPHKTVLQNVIEGPVIVQKRPKDEASRRRPSNCSTQVGLAEKADQYPFQLSGGQQQRVGIARALALQAQAGAVRRADLRAGPRTRRRGAAGDQGPRREGWTMVIVTHEIQFAQQVADQVLFTDGGVILESGPPAEVIGDPKEERTRQFLDRILNPI